MVLKDIHRCYFLYCPCQCRLFYVYRNTGLVK